MNASILLLPGGDLGLHRGSQPGALGRFGAFGGRFVPETLMDALNRLAQAYDEVKADAEFQRSSPQARVDFAPGTTWVCYSDQVLHAAMGGQHMFEQTFQLDAPHLADPSRLLRSAARLYGDDMDRLWGETLPVPRERIRVLGDSDRLGDFRSAYTPGHASHHVSYLHEPSGMAFTGDAAGVRVGDGPVMAPTPPPDVDLEAWRSSLDLIEGWAPAAVAPTHFGRHEDVRTHLDGVRAYLDEWAPRARELDRDAWIAAWREHIAPTGEVPAIEQAMPPDQQWMGLDRYWSARE